jgi:HSP20 family protein
MGYPGRFEEIMNRMFEEFSGRPRRRLLSSGERGEIAPAVYREPFIDVIETDKEIIATAELPGLEKQGMKRRRKRRLMCTEKEAPGVITGRFRCRHLLILTTQKPHIRTVCLR